MTEGAGAVRRYGANFRHGRVNDVSILERKTRKSECLDWKDRSPSSAASDWDFADRNVVLPVDIHAVRDEVAMAMLMSMLFDMVPERWPRLRLRERA